MATLVLGAGPAGLSAAYELSRHGRTAVVLEADRVVGGLARTAEYKGYLFDIGGHRFFTKVSLIEQMWRDVLGADLLTRSRLSRIFYNGKFFRYPLDPRNALDGLGLVETARCGLSYVRSQIAPVRPEASFEDWVSNRFGRRLFDIFFRTYTEKVWGIPCNQIRADWAAQRIKDLSLRTAVWNAIRPQPRGKQQAIKTLIEEFLYPRRGPGMMWERTREHIERTDSEVIFNAPVEAIHWAPGRVTGVTAGGRRYPADDVVSTIPLNELIEKLDPAPPASLRAAASDFHYRDFLTVVLIIRQPDLFPDNWIYIHSPAVKVGRLQNYKNWSPDMVPDPQMTGLGLEYFCFEGDGLWNMSDRDLIALGAREIEQIGLAKAADVVDGTVVRMRKAYPVYDDTYQRGIAAVRDFLTTVPNLQVAGRNGMHRYNNQDHSMLTGILAARNILAGERRFDLWQVNVDADYHESGFEVPDDEIAAMTASQPAVPQRAV